MKKGNRADISHVQCRELQAPLVSALINGFSESIGKEKALQIANKVINKDAELSGKNLADKYLGNSLEVLLAIVKEVWAQDGTMEVDNVSLEEDILRFDVTYCGYAEVYERLGVKELGTVLSCNRDYAFMDGFNSEIELIRTKTIMEGADVCDFCYKRKDK